MRAMFLNHKKENKSLISLLYDRGMIFVFKFGRTADAGIYTGYKQVAGMFAGVGKSVY